MASASRRQVHGAVWHVAAIEHCTTLVKVWLPLKSVGPSALIGLEKLAARMSSVLKAMARLTVCHSLWVWLRTPEVCRAGLTVGFTTESVLVDMVEAVGPEDRGKT